MSTRTNAINFVIKAKKLFPDYDYSQIEYVNQKTPVTLTCPLHGTFRRKPEDIVFYKRGCPECRKLTDKRFSRPTPSKAPMESSIQNSSGTADIKSSVDNHLEDIHKFLETLQSELLRTGINCTIERDASLGSSYKVDFLIVLRRDVNKLRDEKLDTIIKRLAIDFNDFQRHSEQFMPRKAHLEKLNNIEKLYDNVQLLNIWENEWTEKRVICESRIRQILGITKHRIFARNCRIKLIDASVACAFIEKNHIQGKIAAPIVYGLYFKPDKNINKEYLVAVMTFGQLRKNMGQNARRGHYELYRFCNAMNFTVIGGASKLFKHFLKVYNPVKVISFANRRWSTNNEHTLYHHLGFEYVGDTEPSYFYNMDGRLVNRFGCRKDVLISKYGCKPEDTEHNFCKSKGWFRIYDCGNLKFELTTSESECQKDSEKKDDENFER